MKSNYHNHTYRCNHALMCSDEEYVLKAIELGYDEIGFSEHAMFPDILKVNNMRPTFLELDEYLESINNLKVKYQKQIKIYVALECEYFKEYHDYLKSLLDEKKVDYLIFGNHFLHHEEGRIYALKDEWKDANYLKNYCLKAIEACESGLFKIFAHPDLLFTSPRELNEENVNYLTKMCLAFKKRKVYLEINEGGIRRGLMNFNGEERYPYPCEAFWKIAKKCKNKVVIGVDAHSPSDYVNDADKIAHDFAKKLKIKVARRIKF